MTKPTFWEKAKLCWYELLSWCHLLSIVLCVGACAGVHSAYAAGSATASDVALKGGMSIIDGTFITAIFMGLSSVITAIGFVLWGRKKEDKLRSEIANQLKATITNDPLHVQNQGPYVTVGECKQHRCAIEKRIETIGPTLERIFKKLTEIDRKDEDRINSVHRRVDPLIEKLAANSAKIEMIEKRSVSGASD